MNKITVIIPTYQPKRYLFETLKSLQLQQRVANNVIIVLNGSQEPYLTQIKQWISDLNMSNATIIYSPVKGVSAARNLALDHNTSNYVVFLDDDDLVNPEYLSELLKKASPESIVASNFLSFTDDEQHQYFQDYCGREFRRIRPEKTCLKPHQCPSVFSSCCGKLIPTGIIGKNRFNSNLFCGEDSLFMFQLLENGISQVYYAPLAEYQRRIRQNSASRRKYAVRTILKNRLQLLYLYIRCYLLNIHKINLCFFLRRIAAVTKGFFYLIRQK